MNTLTKVFVVLQLVAAVALAVIVAMYFGKEKSLSDQLKAEQTGRMAAQANGAKWQTEAAAAESKFNQTVADTKKQVGELTAQLDAKNTELLTSRTSLDTLQSQITEANASVQKLTGTVNSQQARLEAREKELDTIRPDFTKLTQQNAELNRSLNEAKTQLDLASKTIRTLQEAIADAKNKPAEQTAQAKAGEAQVARLNVGTPTPVQINGKVAKVEDLNGKTYITLSLGSRDGVQQGNRFTIYRGNTYVGDAVVQRVVPEESVAVITLTAKNAKVQASDLAISGGGM